MTNWNTFDETISSDLFGNMLERIEDKIMEQGALSSLLGSEYTFSLFVTRDGNDVVVNIDLFPESEVSLTADELDQIGDLAVSKVSSGLLKGALKKSEINEADCNIVSNVLINGVRPSFD
jgi:hypothetical protein